MKNTVLIRTLAVLFLALVLTGCTRTNSGPQPTGNDDGVPSGSGTMENAEDNSDMKTGVWSADGKWIAVTTVARTQIDTVILDSKTKKEHETGIFRFILENTDKYDYKIVENQRPDPYVNFIEWCPDSKKVLLSYSFTDDYDTRQTGVTVFNLEKMAVDWMIKLSPAEGEHADIKKPEGFNWESAGYGIESGLASNDIVNGEGVFNRKSLKNSVALFTDALNSRDIKGLGKFTDPEDPERFTDECLKAAMEDYASYFRGKKIVRSEFAGIYPFALQTAVYRLFNAEGRFKDIHFYYDKNNHYQCVDSFMYYSNYARRLMSCFIDALKKEDAAALKAVLNEDDLEYPAEKVQEIINNYKKGFVLGTLSFRFTGNLAEDGALIYAVNGKKEGLEREHEMKIVFGDGMVAIRDEWIPDR